MAKRRKITLPERPNTCEQCRFFTAEFTAFLDKVQQFAAGEGIILPNPEDLDFEQFYQQYKDFI